jgi:hypothetical protein
MNKLVAFLILIFMFSCNNSPGASQPGDAIKAVDPNTKLSDSVVTDSSKRPDSSAKSVTH